MNSINRHQVFIVLGLGSIVLLLVGLMVFFSRDLSEKEARIADLEAQISSLSKPSSTEAIKDKTGYDQARVDADTKVSEDLFKQIFTWDSYKTYEFARNSALEHMDSASSFFTDIMPHVTDADGVNDIDTRHLDLMFKSVKPYVVSIDGDKYTYESLVEVVSSDKNGALGSGKLLVHYTTDADHGLHDISVELMAP